ncbi:CoA transferase [Sphingopyxis granuli]|uniref:CaiB/BaiF CoA transferase family protein n=1 Tax=Sphingopyxis granuli TaxID=267128 RepID=UPI001F53651F|nr:CaiB/BaiF CoA-transferase family protein [Sphingopyxis granuli]UNK81071.1 CoA transferase [Sphingopyxis granuli]
MIDNDVMSEREGPCRGLLVVDMSSLVSGPYCGRILSDLGATVIKVETPHSDAARSAPPLHNGHSAYFEQINCGKLSLCADPKDPESNALIRDLCSVADVFIQNSRPGAMERIGLGYEALAKLNPGLVYLSITGYGETGPLAGLATYDNAIQAVTGFTTVQGSAGAPKAIQGPVADKISAMSAANAALAALLDRERSGGLGQKVCVRMVSAYANVILLEEMNNETFQSADIPHFAPLVDSLRPLKTADGQVMGLMVKTQQFEAFCKVLGREELLTDERFSNMHSMIRHMGLIYDLVADDLLRFTTAEFIALMNEASVPFSPVLSTREFLESDYATLTNSVSEIEDPEFGVLRHLNYPANFSRAPVGGHRRAPKLGEHNEAVAEFVRSETAKRAAAAVS